MSISGRLDRALEGLPRLYPGPGGAVAVLRDGEILVRHAWGWANAERRIPFTPRTLFRMCSITKQFTCALVMDAFPDPSALDKDVCRHLPHLNQAAPKALHLCHNQSGLRDYWAVGMLHGALPDTPFGDREASAVIAGTKSLQFKPGTRFSYVNQNFRILSDVLQERSGRSFAELLHDRIFQRVGMNSAFLAADTRAMPDGTEGYEGAQASGFRAADNNILWTGDAGLGGSLDDMIAWEKHIDATRDDTGALYSRISAPVQFAEGADATYGFGLGRGTELGRPVTSHGGGLRGWRSHRLYARSERISIVVMFNHLSDAHAAAAALFAATLDEGPQQPANGAAAPDWFGTYIEPETGIVARIDTAADGRVQLRYGHSPEQLDLLADGTAHAGSTRLRPERDGVWMDRTAENQSSLLRPCVGVAAKDIAGRFHCAELNAELTIFDAGGAFYGGFSGFLGQGRLELLDPVGPDVWMLPCHRALDYSPPGDWSLVFSRDANGHIDGVEVGCWLARRVRYSRIP